MTYMSDEPVSKSMTSVCPPTLTGERNSASFWLGDAVTLPVSEPVASEASSSEKGIRVVEMSSSGTNP